MAFLDFLVVYWIRNHGNSVFDAPPALLKKRFKGFKGLTRKGKRKSIRSLVVSLKAGSVPDGCSKKHRDSKKSTAGVKPSGHPSRVRRKKHGAPCQDSWTKRIVGSEILTGLSVGTLSPKKNEDYPENVGYMIY